MMNSIISVVVSNAITVWIFIAQTPTDFKIMDRLWDKFPEIAIILGIVWWFVTRQDKKDKEKDDKIEKIVENHAVALKENAAAVKEMAQGVAKAVDSNTKSLDNNTEATRASIPVLSRIEAAMNIQAAAATAAVVKPPAPPLNES